ncbi:hypothetical protein [Streptomyces galbus]|jgi:hypothetical protein|uniref:DUF3618 domain-containing protein n=2 Tax=Streptomyces galbus TaxID=33898 RepID=A0A4U5WWV8_STRGB|nr:hypothetical protein [Streptomyces galbus]TKT06111.1 hypothetical protein E4U92_29190 [Streptomyces galbus]GHD51002.1 hypothetical protein GCM10010335_62140 [Streptomyces galbus]
MSQSVPENSGRLQQVGESVRAETTATAGQTREAAGQVATTAAQQAKTVADEVRHQAGSVVGDLRGRVMDEAEGQTKRAAGVLRQWAQDLADLADGAPGDTPARSLTAQLADRGHRAADYVDRHGVEGIVGDVQRFARRRPGLFLGGALVAGLVAGRLGKSAGRAAQSAGAGQERAAAAVEPPGPVGPEVPAPAPGSGQWTPAQPAEPSPPPAVPPVPTAPPPVPPAAAGPGDLTPPHPGV